MKPDFMIIGAQKCAASWLKFHLERHPQIALPADTGSDFFSLTANLNLPFSKTWLERFAGAAHGQRVGDVNTRYFWTDTDSRWSARDDEINRRIPETVHGFLGGDLQLIISLRDPVERTVSAYLHHISNGELSPDQSLLESDAHLGIVDMGFFGAHLQNWLQVFHGGQFLVLRDLPSDQPTADELIAGTLKFLGITAAAPDHDFEDQVFPGMQRLRLEGGVWVSEENPAIATHLPLQRKLPSITENGKRYLRLVDPDELEELEQVFRTDQQHLNRLLASPDITVLDPQAS